MKNHFDSLDQVSEKKDMLCISSCAASVWQSDAVGSTDMAGTTAVAIAVVLQASNGLYTGHCLRQQELMQLQSCSTIQYSLFGCQRSSVFSKHAAHRMCRSTTCVRSRR
jgi:hypothetical protein